MPTNFPARVLVTKWHQKEAEKKRRKTKELRRGPPHIIAATALMAHSGASACSLTSGRHAHEASVAHVPTIYIYILKGRGEKKKKKTYM